MARFDLDQLGRRTTARPSYAWRTHAAKAPSVRFSARMPRRRRGYVYALFDQTGGRPTSNRPKTTAKPPNARNQAAAAV